MDAAKFADTPELDGFERSSESNVQSRKNKLEVAKRCPGQKSKLLKVRITCTRPRRTNAWHGHGLEFFTDDDTTETAV